MAEADAAVGHFRQRMVGILDVGFLVDDLCHTLAAGSTLRQHHENHAEHHQRHQYRHHIGEQRGQLARRQRATHNEVRTPPRQGDDAAIHHHVHHRVVPGHQRLCPHKQPIQSLGSTRKLLVLVVLAHKCLHHPDGGHVLLHALVQLVVLLIHLREQLRHMRDDIPDGEREDDHGHYEDDAKPRVDQQAHHHTQHQPEGRAHRYPQYLLIGSLQVAHVGGHTRHQSRRRELVDVGKREPLDVAIHGPPQVAGKAARGIRGRTCRPDAEGQAQKSHAQHDGAIKIHILHVARRQTLVYQRGRDVGYEHVHHHLAGRQQRSEQRCLLVRPYLFV